MAEKEILPYLDRDIAARAAKLAAAKMMDRVEQELGLVAPVQKEEEPQAAPVPEPVVVSVPEEAGVQAPISDNTSEAAIDVQKPLGRRRGKRHQTPKASGNDNLTELWEQALAETESKAPVPDTAQTVEETPVSPEVGLVHPKHRRKYQAEEAPSIPAPFDVTPEKPAQETWTLDRLFAEIADQEEFLVKSPNNPEKTRFRYRRTGDDIVTKKGDVATDMVLARLGKGWTLEKIVASPTVDVPAKAVAPEAVAPQPAEQPQEIPPKDVSVPPAAPEAPIPVSPEVAAPQPAPIPEPVEPAREEESERNAIERLRILVGEMRLEFVTTDHKQNSVWQKLKGIFKGNISEERGDQDTQSARERYERALMNLEEAELAELKKSGLQGEALREQMGKMLRYYKYDERINLFNTRNQVAIESKNFPERVLSAAEQVGRWYNKLPRSVKYTVGAACIAGSLGSAVVGAGGVAAAIGSVSLVKKLIATAGTAVVADTAVEQGAEYLRKRGAEKELEKELKELTALNAPLTAAGADTMKQNNETVHPEALQELEKLLAKDIKSLDRKFKNQKREGLWRRTMVWGTAAGLSTVFAYKSFFGGGRPEVGAKARTGVVTKLPGTESSNPEAVAAGNVPADEEHTQVIQSGEGEAIGNTAAPESVPASEVAPATGGEESAFLENLPPLTEPPLEQPVPEVSSEGSVLLERYEVTAADGKRGLWGILDHRLPNDVAPNDRNRVIQSLENIIAQKLESMSPEELKEVGFRTGDINKIYPGTEIDFEKLLTPQEIQSVLEGHSVAAPNVVEAVAQETVGQPVEQTVVGHVEPTAPGAEVSASGNTVGAETLPADETISRVAATEGTSAETDVATWSNPRAYLTEHPEDFGRYNNTLGRLRMGIFMLSPGESVVPTEYDYSMNGEKLGKTQVMQVLRDLRGFEDGHLSYDQTRNPLHYDQMRALSGFVEASGKAFGPGLTRLEVGETADSYTRRMATLALRTGRDIPGFFKR